MPSDLAVQLIQEPANCGIQLIEPEETPVPQPGHDPALRQQHGRLDLCLVLGLAWPRRHNRGIVMRRHVGIGSVDRRIIETGFGYARLEIVRNHLRGHAAEECEGADVGRNPIRQLLRPARLDIGVIGGGIGLDTAVGQTAFENGARAGFAPGDREGDEGLVDQQGGDGIRAVAVFPVPGANIFTGVSSAKIACPPCTWRPMAFARGSSSAVDLPTQSASVERSRSRPSRSKIWLWR